MEISEIKQKLSIGQVLDHYGLKADKNKRLCCPFHNDKTPSMQVYPETNTVFCFSSNCKLHGKAIDQIDFILHKEGLTKYEAIERAKTLLGHTSNGREEIPTDSYRYEKLFKVFQANYKKSEYAQRYLQNRKINAEAAQAGFNATGWAQMKQCVIFPLKDKDDKVVSFYGRSIYNKNEAKHFYSKDRKGLYPRWPIHSTKTLILTEAVLDAASIYQIHDLTSHLVTVLACYGTNGFTQDHEQAIKELKYLEEVILFFDGDDAGREGVKRVSDKLRELKPEIKLSQVETPEGEDVNSLLQSHEPGIIKHLIENRKPIITQELKEIFSSTETPKPAQPLVSSLDTSNPHKLIYKTVTANYYIKGGLRNETDSMRISLDIEHPQSQRKSRSKLDLYEDKQVEKIAREAGEKLQLRADLIQLDLEILTDQLEAYREKLHATKADTSETPITVPAHMEPKCKDFLQKPKLITRLNDLIGKAGVTGEDQSRIFLTIIALTYKMHEPLHALIQGSSGSGKTHLLAKISSFIPQEDRKHFTRVTEGSLYNYGMYDLKNKLICLEDLDGMKEEAQLAFRELQSRGMISSATSVKNEQGNINAQEKIVYGPIASMSCTTKGEIYEDNLSRCFIIAIDESLEQSRKVIQYQNQKAAGQIDQEKEKQYTQFIQYLVRMLTPAEVINPYADKVHLPEEAHKIRRLNSLYQSFVKAITLVHQYQRRKDQYGRLISEKEDLQVAAEIMFESILLKVDELDGSLRQFYEQLKEYIKGKGNDHYEFSQREIRQTLHISKTQLQRYLNDLVQLEYIKQTGGYANRGFNYKVMYWDNIAALRAKVKRHLQGQLDQLELVAV
jgi:DNA primase/energy-coupling factor transporter ATP-binding protein EcfA2